MKKRNKKYAKSTVAAAIAVGSIVAVAPMATQANTHFADVKVSDYFYEDVLQLAERGVINGFSDGTFKPKQDVTRGQAAKIIAGILGLDTKNVENPGFKDVPKSHPYYGAIAALANAGIINGYENNTFRSEDVMQRNHMAKIIAGAFNLEASADTKTPFTDVRAEYAKYISALYAADITTGLTATKFGGTSNVTRGQLVSFVVRAEKASTVVAKEVTFTISQVKGNKVEEYTVPTALKGLLNESNNAALQGAVVKATVLGDEIVDINSLQLNTAGTEGSLVTLDGGNATIAGDLVVNADFLQVKNVTVQGNVSLTNSVVNGFSADALINNGEFIVEDATGPIASATPIFANTTKGPKVDFKNSNVKKVHVKRNNVVIASDVKLPELTVSAKVSTIQVDADVAKVIVDVTVNIAISGTGSFDEVALENAVEMALKIIGTIAKLSINNVGAKVDVAATIKIGEVTLPANSTAADIIKNYDAIKGNIDNVVVGDTPTTPGNGNSDSSGSGSGSGGSGSGGSGSGGGDSGSGDNGSGGGDSGSGGGGSNPDVEAPVTVTGVNATIGSDGKTITVTASVANTTAETATIEFYEVIDGVVSSAPKAGFTRHPEIKNGKVDFWIGELPAGTYQVKVTVGSSSGIAAKYVTVLSGEQPPLTVGKVTNFEAISKDREIELTWSAVEDVDGYEIWYKQSDTDTWIRGWSEDEPGLVETSLSIVGLENDKQYTFKITPYKFNTSGEIVYGENTAIDATPGGQTETTPATPEEIEVLTNVVTEAQDKALAAVPGTEAGQYPQSSIDALNQAILIADAVAKTVGVTKVEVDKALKDLQDAIVVFEAQKVVDSTVANVDNFADLKTAIENTEIKTINIMGDIDVEEKLSITSEKHINGNNHTLTANSPQGWDGLYVFHFYQTIGSVKDINITGADAAIYVNGSIVTLDGIIDVSGNEFGGIEVSKGANVESEAKLNIGKATLKNTDEANDKPTIWEDQIGSVDALERVEGFVGMKVDFNQKNENNIQRFYYLGDFSAPNPVEEVDSTVANVDNFADLKTAIENTEIKTINIMGDIDVEEKLSITSEKHINGNNHTLTANSPQGWDGLYVFHFYQTIGSVTGIKITGADAAMYVNGSTVTLDGVIDVSGNEFGGIEVSQGKNVELEAKLIVGKATLKNTDEADNKPTIWEDQIGSVDALERVEGFVGMKVDFNQKNENNIQRFYYLGDFSAPNPVEEVDSTVANVDNFADLKTAIENTEIKTINIMGDIDVEEKLSITSEKHINGNNHTLTANGSDGWTGYYVFHFYQTIGSVKDINITGADAAMYVNGSTVTLNGVIDVSGNEFGGIEVSQGKNVESETKLNIGKATLKNTDEANDKPTIWEDQIGSVDALERVEGFVGMKVDFNQKNENNIQRFYYLGDFSAPNPVVDKDSIDALTAYLDTAKEHKYSTVKNWINIKELEDEDSVTTTVSMGENFVILNGFVKFI